MEVQLVATEFGGVDVRNLQTQAGQFVRTECVGSVVNTNRALRFIVGGLSDILPVLQMISIGQPSLEREKIPLSGWAYS